MLHSTQELFPYWILHINLLVRYFEHAALQMSAYFGQHHSGRKCTYILEKKSGQLMSQSACTSWKFYLNIEKVVKALLEGKRVSCVQGELLYTIYKMHSESLSPPPCPAKRNVTKRLFLITLSVLVFFFNNFFKRLCN